MKSRNVVKVMLKQVAFYHDDKDLTDVLKFIEPAWDRIQLEFIVESGEKSSEEGDDLACIKFYLTWREMRMTDIL